MTMEDDIREIRIILERRFRDELYGYSEEEKTAIKRKVTQENTVVFKDGDG